MRTLLRFLIIAVVSGACADSAPAPDPAPDVSLELLVTSEALPLSDTERFAVLSEDRACVLDSWEVHIVCGDREWRSTVVLGRKGRGPGEILVPGPLLPMPDGGLAYHDLKNSRITLYGPDLSFSRHVRLDIRGSVVPPIFRDSLLVIAESAIRRAERKLHIYDLRADSLIASLPFVLDLKPLGLDSVVASPYQRTADQILLRGTGERLILMNADASRIEGHIPPPAFEPNYPDSVDVEELRADLKAISGVLFEKDVERLRTSRKHHYVRETLAQFDAHGRLWLLTNRPSPRSETLFDHYRDTTFLGTLPVPGRVLAFRIRDSLLVTMTRDAQSDTSGINQRRLNWYRIRAGGS